MEIRYLKSAAILLDRDCINRRGLDLSKEVLLVSVYQRAADLPAVKVGGKKKFLLSGPVQTRFARVGQFGRIFFQTSNFDSGFIESSKKSLKSLFFRNLEILHVFEA